MKLVVKDMKKFNRFIALVLIFASLILSLFFFPKRAKGLGYNRSYSITVVSGDTVWDIASSLNSGKDTREVVYDIYRLNNMSSTRSIYPGQVLELPIY